MNRRWVQWLTLGLLIAAVVALLLTSTVSPVAVTDDEAPAASDAASISLSDLYVITADSGSLAEDASGSFELTLEGVAEPATFFGNRPARDAGTERVSSVLDVAFDPSLQAPNAALVGTLPDGSRSTIPMELTGPKYDEATATLRFAATLLDEGETTPGLSTFEFDTVDDTPTEWQPADLYLDSGYHNCSFVFRNDLDTDLTLGNFSPDSPDRWGGGSPPTTVAAHSSATVDFKFQADSGQVEGEAEYVVVFNPQQPATFTFTWTCNYHTIGPVSTDNENCTTNAIGVYCTTYAYDGNGTTFWVQSSG